MAGAVQAQFDSTIPVIDMNDYYSPARHKLFIQNLSDALSTVGFVAIINSNVDVKILDAAYIGAKEFYALPYAEKLKVWDPKLNGQRGYILSETAKGKNAKDFKEFYHIAREYPQEILDQYGYAPNLWPDKTTFKQSMLQLIAELDKYSYVIEQAIAESINQPKDYFNNMTQHGGFLLRPIHYPANPPENILWAAAHTDIDLFTILPRATAEGLQLLNANGEWVDVVVPDGALIINAGDMLQNITNGVYKSAVHRVINKDPSKERYSIVAFIHTRPNDAMGPLQQFVQQVGSQKFANVTCKELLFERLIDLGLHSQELLQDFAASNAIERLIDVNRASPAAMIALREANLASPKVLAALDKH